MRSFLTEAGFVDVKIQIKENAAEIISAWMPGSGAENVVTSAYVTARKPRNFYGARDDVFAAQPEAPMPLPTPTPAEDPAAAC